MKEENSCKFFGTYRKTLWRNNASGATLFLFETKQQIPQAALENSPVKIRNQFTGKDEILYSFVVSAIEKGISEYSENTPLLIHGNWQKNKKTGKIFLSLSNIEERTSDVITTVQFLISEEVGLEYDQAVSLAGSLEGTDLFKLAFRDDAKEVIMASSSLSAEETEGLIDVLQNTVAERKLFSYLAPTGASFAYASRGVKKYGRKAIKKLFDDPYLFGASIGLSYHICERLAKGFGIRAFDNRRIEGLSRVVLRSSATGGNTYCQFSVFMDAVKRMERHSPFAKEGFYMSPSEFKGIAAAEVGDTRTGYVKNMPVIYSNHIRKVEEHAAAEAVRVIRSGKKNENFSLDLIAAAEKANNIKLANQQKEAIKMAFSTDGGIKILTGGPGTGKTTVLNSIITVYKMIKAFSGEPDKLALFATTARAAQRSAEVTGVEASTVHRGLNYRPFGEGATHKDASDPIDADFIIIDEVSMMDIELFDIFITAVQNGTTVLLVGDIHQLESVGPGALLRDLLKLDGKFVPATMLTEVFRQKGDSLIIDNANKVNEGAISLDEGKDFKIFNTPSSEESLNAVKKIMTQIYDPEDPFKAQILCPARKGVSGIENMNKELQELLNHNEDKILYGEHVFKKGDKIMITKNDYASDLYNGDIGLIREVDASHNILHVEIRGNMYELGSDKFPSIALAYAISIHKSQGSEFQYAVCVLPEQPSNMLVRNLFYTAITRAKKMAICINEKGKSIERAIVTDNSNKRRTLFFEDLKKELGID